MKQLGTAWSMYMQDYDAVMIEQIRPPCYAGPAGGALACSVAWPVLAMPYVKSWDVIKCPSWSASMPMDRTQNPVLRKPLSYLYSKMCPTSWWLNPQYTGKQGFCTDCFTLPITDAMVEDPSGTLWLVEGGNRTTGPLEYQVYWAGMQVAYEPHADYGMNTYYSGSSLIGCRVGNPHFDGFNAVFGDGHAKWVKWKSGTPRMYTIQAD
ncbi:MAG: hypothetical protein HY321_04975 [Armatimonadetes bacterium]|nr:hypothetical protein [Armatimonadota bacterium]